MNIEQFNNLVEQYTYHVVYQMEGEYCFSIGEDPLLYGKECQDNMARLEQERNNVNGIGWWVVPGDEVVSCITVKELSDLDKVVGLEEFIVKFVGENCLTREDEYND